MTRISLRGVRCRQKNLGISAVAFFHYDLSQLAGQRFGKAAQRAADHYIGKLYRQFDLVLAPSQAMVNKIRGLGVEAARARLQAGIDWFGQRGWPLAGFVAPALMMSGAAFGALSEFKFLYATRYRAMVLLPDYLALHSPALVYTARNKVGDALVRAAVGLMATRLVEAPLVRLALHPADAHHPATLEHAKRFIAALLREPEPMTKAKFARQIRHGCLVCAC